MAFTVRRVTIQQARCCVRVRTRWSRFPPRRFRLAEIIPQPNFCQPWRKIVDKAESAESWQICFRTAVNVLNVFRTANTSSPATKKFSFHAAFCLVSKVNFTANPHPPRTLRAIETIPPIRDEHEGDGSERNYKTQNGERRDKIWQ